jgi:hypothetical protein
MQAPETFQPPEGLTLSPAEFKWLCRVVRRTAAHDTSEDRGVADGLYDRLVELPLAPVIVGTAPSPVLDAALKRAGDGEALAEARLRTIEGHLSNLTDRAASIEVLRDHLAAADELAVKRGKEVEARDATIADLRETLAKTQGQLDGYRARDLDHARDL